MNVLAFHLGHDGSITVVSENEVIAHHQLDRYNKFKHQSLYTFEVLQKVKDFKIKFDKIILTSMGSNNNIRTNSTSHISCILCKIFLSA